MIAMLPPLPVEQPNVWAGPVDDGLHARSVVRWQVAVGAFCLLVGAFGAVLRLLDPTRTSWLGVVAVSILGVMILAEAGTTVLASPGQARRGRARWRGQSRGWRGCMAVVLISALAELAVLAVSML
ncbi:MAG: hypothetical protein QOI76_4002 [Frankiales bacterium]|jgi:uncharacterized membrane protein YdfJ with MMPL/SSD domain|nr:hypothetical protein [Frankiales bacterium]